jgi:hypothetical protein
MDPGSPAIILLVFIFNQNHIRLVHAIHQEKEKTSKCKIHSKRINEE